MSKAHLALTATRRWQAVRVAVFERDGYRCRACGLPGRLECDHVQPLERGGDPWELDNLQTLCRVCHIAKTSQENRAARGNDSPAARAWRELVKELR